MRAEEEEERVERRRNEGFETSESEGEEEGMEL